MIIPISKPCFIGNEKKYLNEALDSGWISSKGPFLERFSRNLEDFFGLPNILTSSGTTALHLALIALGIGPGDEVIVPASTFVSTANAILYVGATVRFADVDSRTWNVSWATIEPLINRKTKAIIAVHLYGLPVDLDPIVNYCSNNGIFLIEDAAEAIGAEYKGRKVGTFGDASIFSLYGNKTITSGEGGVLLMKNVSFLERAKNLRDQAMNPHSKFDHLELGYNYRMTNLQASIGLAQFENLNLYVEGRSQIFDKYRKLLNPSKWSMQQISLDVSHGFWLVGLVCQISILENTKLESLLMREGIETRPFFKALNEVSYFGSNDTAPIASGLRRSGICVPTFFGLSDGEISRVTDVLNGAGE